MEGVVKCTDYNYPKYLSEIPDPPKQLYWKGVYNESVFENCLAVVGDRAISTYGERVIEKIFSEISPKTTIISGFMYGVDSKFLSEALRRGLKTIVVLPCGLDLIYPKSLASLYQKNIDSGGLVLYEYEGLRDQKGWNYLRRNRVVAGLSKAMLVIEASEKSSSLYTARLMKNYGRQVYAVPGSIFSELSLGCISVLKEFAKPLSSGTEVNAALGLN